MMTDFSDVLDLAVYNGDTVIIKTIDRGFLIGKPIGVDEFDTDEDRLGYYVDVGANEIDTIFLDEITSVSGTPAVSHSEQREYAV